LMAERLSQASTASSDDASRLPLLPNRQPGYHPPAHPQSPPISKNPHISPSEHNNSNSSSIGASPRSSIVLVRADGTGVCMDGSAHSWKQVYPPQLWCVACGCLLCCGPLYCLRHPQRHCRKCGIVIKHPILLNHKRKSCDGVSLAFYLMWSLGDLFNLAGALMEGLILTAILLPLYYILTDCVVLLQFYIYRNNHVCSCAVSTHAADEESALITANACSVDDNNDLHHRCDDSSCPCQIHHNHESHSHGDQTTISSRSTRYILLCLVAALLLATFAAHYYHVNKHWFDHIDKRRAAAQLLGYLSAAVYLGAYIPQLIRNYRTKSTEGLSLLMFILVIVANVTYCLSILTFHKPSREYIEKYASWLLGASGTIWLELGVLYQFHLYRRNHNSDIQSTDN
ncbi:hypothetical protein GGF39_003964, partial [Coemansia sp. RSA 1721]